MALPRDFFPHRFVIFITALLFRSLPHFYPRFLLVLPVHKAVTYFLPSGRGCATPPNLQPHSFFPL